MNRPSVFEFAGFAIAGCLIPIEDNATRYLRAVHRAALELAVQNRYGLEVGGFWLSPEQILQLRQLADFYPANEATKVREVVELYLQAQLNGLNQLTSQVLATEKQILAKPSPGRG